MLTGCELTNMIDSFSNDSNSVDLYNMLADDAMYPQSADTVKAGDKVSAADAKLQSATAAGQWWNPFDYIHAAFDDTYCMSWNAESQEEKLQGKYDKALSKYNTTKARDPIFQQAKTEAESENEWSTGANGWDMLKIILIVGFILIILIIVILLLRRRGAPPAQPVVIQQPVPTPAPSPAPAPAPDTAEYDMNYEKRYKALSDMCKKVNMDPDDVLKQCGGDIDKAFLEVSLMT